MVDIVLTVDVEEIVEDDELELVVVEIVLLDVETVETVDVDEIVEDDELELVVVEIVEVVEIVLLDVETVETVDVDEIVEDDELELVVVEIVEIVLLDVETVDVDEIVEDELDEVETVLLVVVVLVDVRVTSGLNSYRWETSGLILSLFSEVFHHVLIAKFVGSLVNVGIVVASSQGSPDFIGSPALSACNFLYVSSVILGKL